ncbi:MAG: NAD-dependent epimerase/dehydratase family protein [Bacillota bacterium]
MVVIFILTMVPGIARHEGLPETESDVAPAPNIESMEQREGCVERLYHEERLAAGQMAERTTGGGASMVTVTGATGHIGNVLVRELLAHGQRVRALIPPFEDPAPLDGLDVEKVEGDILDVGSLVRAFKWSDVVYHLAGIVSIVSGKRDLLYRVNVVGTRNVVETCLETGVRRLVYTSSIHAIAEPPPGVVIDESLPFDPDSMAWEYDESKARATLEVLRAQDRELNPVILCPTGVIGPYDFRYPLLLADGRRMREIGLEKWVAEQEARDATGFAYADVRFPEQG